MSYRSLQLLLVLCSFLVAVVGCGGGPSLEPVSGKVTAGERPLKTGTVTFHPDKTKGNESEFTPVGEIQEDGTYTMMTNGKKGAPEGWYNVTVVSELPKPKGADEYAVPTYAVAQQEMDPKTTTMKVEVKAGTTNYDLKPSPR